MTRVTIFKSARLEVVSYGNGLSYAIHDNEGRVSAFVQGDDATGLREELEAYPEDLPLEEFWLEQIAIRQ